ncbi:MAG: hypothetical protein P4L86_11545 [Mycobacterium sp.]|nr:hypothetical protein [Mycobacterium sp.]
MSAPADAKILAHQFLASPYASVEFVNWSIDRRVERFLHNRGLRQVADDGDSLRDLVDQIMDCHNSEIPAEHNNQTAADRVHVRR